MSFTDGIDHALPANITPDEDEGIADVSSASSTTSVRSSILDYPVEHGRQYHAYRSGVYHRPNDELELDRLDLMNELILTLHDGELHRAPLRSAPERILDLGTGTGLWCMDMGDKYPRAEITGVDISASAPAWVLPNVRFEIDDVEDEWLYGKPFDYIHSRYLAGSIRDWPRLVQQSFNNLKPGGWIELEDFDIDYYSQDGSLTAEHALRRWLTTSYKCESQTGRTLRPGKWLEHWVREAGFRGIRSLRNPIPLGRWPKDKRLKKIGLYNWAQLWEGLEGMSLRLFIDILGWTREDLELLLMEVRQDLQNTKIHPIFDLYTVWAQKPDD